MVWVDTVRVCNIKVVEYAYSVYEYVVASCRMKSPKRSVNNRKFLKGNVVAFFNVNNCRTGIKVTCYIISVLALNKGVTVCINSTLTAYCAVVSLVSIDENKARLACNRISDKRRFRIVNQLVGSDISVDISRCL